MFTVICGLVFIAAVAVVAVIAASLFFEDEKMKDFDQ